ncbi:hypothetical protein [Chryseobacterium tongliaoense]|uniref:hypothetical protein n=1 Tax=Chryseobacterium tongliaoense TaxID=3240933 RepID=UPI003515031E
MIHEYKEIPCWITYIHPYTFIVPDGENPWTIPLKEINDVSYNHSNLLRVVTKLQTEENQLDSLICYDGTIGLAQHGKFQEKNHAINYFNKILLALNLIGFSVEYVDHRDVLSGAFEDGWKISNSEMGGSALSHLHSKNRWRVGSNMDSIYLDNPRILTVNEFKGLLKLGLNVLESIPNLSPKFLNIGLTEIKYGNWDLVLSNLWISSEQLVDFLWHSKFLINIDKDSNSPISGRKQSLRDDNRTWSSSVKLELLFQTGLIDKNTFENLFNARKVRNKLVHEGKSANKEIAIGLLSAIINLLKTLVGPDVIKLIVPIFRNSLSVNKSMILNSELFDGWRNIPDNEIIEKVLGYQTTENARKLFMEKNKNINNSKIED